MKTQKCDHCYREAEYSIYKPTKETHSLLCKEHAETVEANMVADGWSPATVKPEPLNNN